MNSFGTEPVDGRAISKDSSEKNAIEADTVLLTDLSARAISLFQKQSELTDKLWAYFGTYSGVALLAALGAPIFAQNGLLFSDLKYYSIILFSLLAVAYWIFSYSNRESLSVAQEALGRMASQATVSSGIPFAVIKTSRAMAFHRSISTIVLLSLVVGFYSAVVPGFRSLSVRSRDVELSLPSPSTVVTPAPLNKLESVPAISSNR